MLIGQDLPYRQEALSLLRKTGKEVTSHDKWSGLGWESRASLEEVMCGLLLASKASLNMGRSRHYGKGQMNIDECVSAVSLAAGV